MPQYQMYFDTLEGGEKYNVDIREDERLGNVVREILGDLSERGHIMPGVITAFKVVGSGDTTELDLSRPLAAQGVRPGDVLRVIIEPNVAGTSSLRVERLESEWRLLETLATVNRSQLEVLGRTRSQAEDVIRVRLLDSPGLAAAHGDRLSIRDTHTLALVFSSLFPHVPLECYVEEPLFHPNVRPETGFMCLWEQANPRHTIVEALARAQATTAYRIASTVAAHLMNLDAAQWYETVGRPQRLVPLGWIGLQVFQIKDGRTAWLDPSGRVDPSRIDDK